MVIGDGSRLENFSPLGLDGFPACVMEETDGLGVTDMSWDPSCVIIVFLCVITHLP